MKTTVIAMLLFVLCSFNANAQKDYYLKDGIIKGKDFEYKCEIRQGFIVKLSNVKDGKNIIGPLRKDNSDFDLFLEMIKFNTPSVFEDTVSEVLNKYNYEVHPYREDILNTPIPSEYESNRIVINSYFNVETGKPLAIMFSIKGNLRNLPIEAFYEMEQALKKNLVGKVTPEGKTRIIAMEIRFIYIKQKKQ